jgi:cold shock CspA family protein
VVQPVVEVFVHHSGLRVGKEQFRYLVEGEYVELEVIETEGGENKYQGSDVRGIGGGKLMCETRNETSASGNQRGRVNTNATKEWQEMRNHKPKCEIE